MKRLFTLILTALAIVTGANAVETTITWDVSSMGIKSYNSPSGPKSQNNSKDGITAVWAGGEKLQGWSGQNINGSGTITFTSAVGLIKKIEIKGTNTTISNPSAGWTSDLTTSATWNGTPSTSVELSASFNVSYLSQVIFTVEQPSIDDIVLFLHHDHNSGEQIPMSLKVGQEFARDLTEPTEKFKLSIWQTIPNGDFDEVNVYTRLTDADGNNINPATGFEKIEATFDSEKGFWRTPVDNLDLADGLEQGTYIYEFYAEGKLGNYTYTYNNDSKNFRLRFTTNPVVQFPTYDVADITLYPNSTSNETKLTFGKDGSLGVLSPSNDLGNVGSLHASGLRIKAYTTKSVKDDAVATLKGFAQQADDDTNKSSEFSVESSASSDVSENQTAQDYICYIEKLFGSNSVDLLALAKSNGLTLTYGKEYVFKFFYQIATGGKNHLCPNPNTNNYFEVKFKYVPALSKTSLTIQHAGTTADENIPATSDEFVADWSSEPTGDLVIKGFNATPVGTFSKMVMKSRVLDKDGTPFIPSGENSYLDTSATYNSETESWSVSNLAFDLCSETSFTQGETYIYEFYFEGTYDGGKYQYDNNGSKYRIKYTVGEPVIQFYDDKATAKAVVIANEGTSAKTIGFYSDGSCTDTSNKLGEITTLQIKGFEIVAKMKQTLTEATASMIAIVQPADGASQSVSLGRMTSKADDFMGFSTTGNFRITTTLDTPVDVIEVVKNAGTTLLNNKEYKLVIYYQVDSEGRNYTCPTDGNFAEITFTYIAPETTSKISRVLIGTTINGTPDYRDQQNFGELEIGNVESFSIDKFAIFTRDGNDNVVKASMMYRIIREDETTPGRFYEIEASLDEIDTADGDKWSDNHNFNILQGMVPNATYRFEYYFKAETSTGQTILRNGNGSNYIFKFTNKATPTGINGISTDEADENEEIYNIAGQKVGKNYKGLVIKNGKKQIVK
ncbi:MAG: hypothetical protein J6N73_06850 [Prevotella sp.]|nr:hypothetical protein [Prevotella sp.]